MEAADAPAEPATVRGVRTLCTLLHTLKFLPLFPPQLRPRFAALNRSPEGWDKNAGVNRRSKGGFSKCKALPGCGGTAPASSPNAELSLATDSSNSHVGGVMQKKAGDHWCPLGFFSPKVDWDRILLFHFWWGVVSSLSVHLTFPPFLSKVFRSSFGQTTSH